MDERLRSIWIGPLWLAVLVGPFRPGIARGRVYSGWCVTVFAWGFGVAVGWFK